MKTLYIGSQSYKKNTGTNWKLYFFLILFLSIVVMTLKLTGSFIVEKWINKQGSGEHGFAFSVREVGISLGRGQLNLKDVKVFNPKTSAEFLEAPNLTIQINIPDFIMGQEKNITVSADQVDLSISKDLANELERTKNEIDLNKVDLKIAKLNVVQEKEDQSRKMLELNNADIKVKKSEFSFTSSIDDGGKFTLSGNPNSIKGTFKQVSPELFNKLAGDKLPFSFNESKLNADITAQTEDGKIVGEIVPEITKLHLVDEKPGIPTQTIKRILTDELTFTLPFTLKEELTLEYSDTFRKLKTYRKDGPEIAKAQVVEAPKTAKTKKPFSFWPF